MEFLTIFPNPHHSTNASAGAKEAHSNTGEPLALTSSDLRNLTRTLEVSLPDDRGGEVLFSFKAPGWDNLIASANRLLKFEFPTIREIKVYERLIKTNALSTGLSKKILETLPLPSLEKIYRALWEPFFGTGASIANQWITLLLLAVELEEFDRQALVQQDIEQLGMRDTGTMHSYYYRGSLTREQLLTFLSGHGYRTDLFSEEKPGTEEANQLAYLACRRLSAPLPWQELLRNLEPADLEKHHRLAYLSEVVQQLLRQRWTAEPITQNSLTGQLDQLRQWINEGQFSAIGERHHNPCPIRELVIVEGETEKMLLPIFAASLNLNLDKLGIQLMPAGGKNHVLSLYRHYARLLNIPIFIVLDSDAIEIAEEIRPDLRPQDYIFTIQEGEFEDTYDLDLTLQTVNRNYQPYPEVTPRSFRELAESSNTKGRVQTLKVLWQAYNLGSFDKIDFAGKYAEAFQTPQADGRTTPLPTAIRRLIETMITIRGAAGSGKQSDVSPQP